MVWRAGVFSRTSVVMMGSIEVTTFHPRGLRDPKLPPVPDAPPSSSEDSPRAACKEGYPLWTIPMKMAPESHSLRERLWWPKRLLMNCSLPKCLALPGAKPTLVGMLSLVTNESFGDRIIRMSRGKARCKSSYLVC
jgi:hypothetical protein